MVKYLHFRGDFTMSAQPETVKPTRRHSEATKQRIRDSRKDRIPPELERKHISESMMDKPKSEETKAKISAARKGKPMPDSAKAAISKKAPFKLGLMGKQTRFLTLLSTGQSVRTAAEIVGFSPDIAYQLADNEQFRLAITEATMSLRAMLYKDMPDMLDLAKNTLMDTMRSPTARTEVKVKAASHVISLAIFLASADKNFQPPPPTAEDLELIEGEAVGE
jgi:hypothetical protein